jgi:hypothetical protein
VLDQRGIKEEMLRELSLLNFFFFEDFSVTLRSKSDPGGDRFLYFREQVLKEFRRG